jgi:hypothetical protein|tara:strand:+ start:810 stop:1079 length:270 start_codon:yes stop_codon:yes gene_type:complete
MSLSKITLIDKVEFIGKYKTIQVRNCTQIKENGHIISESYSRDSYSLGQELPNELKPYAEGVWTKELKDELQAEMDAMPVVTEAVAPTE